MPGLCGDDTDQNSTASTEKGDKMFSNSRKQERLLATVLTITLMTILSLTASAQTRPEAITKKDFSFVNAVDNSQDFTTFGLAPAINEAGAVAFEATGVQFTSGSVWKWQYAILTPIATSGAKSALGAFGDNVVINSAGRVGFNAKVLSSNDTIIATGDGGMLNKIASASEQGLVGGPFLGISSMNESGTVVFLGTRKGFRSQAFFAGRGGPLRAIVDTATDPRFGGLGNPAINASGTIVFRGSLADTTEGIFLSGSAIKDIADTNTPNFFDFLDPVINDSGTAGGAIFFTTGGVEVFTGTDGGITPRTNPDSSLFTFVDNVSINNRGDVAFFATETVGRDGIFVELTGGSNAVPVIETGDALFGSTVVALSMGRFSFNAGGQIAFHYQLADGRSGIAVASCQH
jgi:hypothetical protein